MSHVSSGWIIAFMIFSSAAWCDEVGTSDPCKVEISRVEAYLRQSGATQRTVPSAPESLAALLHRQRTPGSVERAAAGAKGTVESTLALARELESQGMAGECAAMLKRVELLFDGH